MIPLTLCSSPRRPSGQPIEEEAEAEAPIREVPAEPVDQAEEEEDRSPSRWAYSALDEDNVWGK
jgi:hypothetical protein